MPDTLPLAAAPLSALDIVQRYHQRSKHALNAYAAGPETLDWDAQPDPFRRYAGAVLTPLPLGAEAITTRWADLFEAGRVMAQPLTLASLGALFELSFALSAWKQSGPDRWAVRVNPSSGNLHPTEAWLLASGVPGVADGVHHYAPREHALEHRAVVATDTALSSAAADTTPRAWVALSAIAWREAWKYGERAFRYVQLDTGHAVGALRFAAAVLGWQLRAVPVAALDLAHLLGLDRDADFGRAEREEPELLFELVTGTPAAQPAQDAAALTAWLAGATWHGQANRLDAHPMYRWPVIDEVMAATRIATTARMSTPAASPLPAPASASSASPSPALAAELSSLPAATLIRQRRSAQRFDARARLPLAALWPLLQALHPGRLPFDAGPATPAVQVLLFAHRVDGLPAGAYLLPRGEAGWAHLRAQLPATEQATRVADAPADVPLWCLAQNPALAGTLRTLNCHQALGSDALLGFALLAEFNPLPDAAAYRARLHEAGLIGQALYLAAEAAGLRGTGIGCFFDDALHQLIGLPEPGAALAPLQSVYHFTVGVAISDPRIVTTAPYGDAEQVPRSPRTMPARLPPTEPSMPDPGRFQRLTPTQARDWLAQHPDALLLDARDAAHHARSHLAGSLRLDGRNHESLLLREPKQRPVFIYCYHGNASQTYAGMFSDFGFAEVADLIGGWAAVDPAGQLSGPQSWGPASPPAAAAACAEPAPAVPLALAQWLTAEGFDAADPARPGAHGNTPLMHAAWRGAHHSVDALLALQVPLAATNGDGNNALWLACVNGEPGLIRALAARGVPIDHANLTGATALMYAASSGKAEVVATLLALGANPALVTQDDYSALDMAATLECLQLLRQATRRTALA